MSASLNATVALLNAKGIRYKLERSPHTGQMATYSQTKGASVLVAGTPVNTTALVTAINSGLSAQSVDFLPASTTVGYLGMAQSETYYPEAWINTTVTADGQLKFLDKTGKLIEPITACVIVLGIILAFFVVDTLWNMYKAEHTYAYRDPNDGTIKTVLGETLFLTTVNNLYWYTCPKDGTGVGLQSKYPTLASYKASPEYESEVAWLKDHCATAQDLIGAHLNEWITYIIIGAAIVGGIYVVAKILPSLTRKNK